MEIKEILQFIHHNFVPNRGNLIPLLRAYDINDERFLKIWEGMESLQRPYHDRTGISEKDLTNINFQNPDLETLGDISDIYIILLNKDLNNANFDFNEDKVWRNCELHFAKVWINWFLPVYYIETVYDKYFEDERIIEIGKLSTPDEFEANIIQKIQKFIESEGFSFMNPDIMHETVAGARTDCSVDSDATIFDCLFSDAITAYPFKLIQRKYLRDKDDLNTFFEPKPGEVYYIRRDTFDKKGCVIDLEVVELTCDSTLNQVI
jgi:hypothetical protein